MFVYRLAVAISQIQITFDIESIVDNRHFSIAAIQGCAIGASWQNI